MKDKFITHKLSKGEIDLSELVREYASRLDDLIDGLPDSREKSLALTKLEESVMWANKAIALHGLNWREFV